MEGGVKNRRRRLRDDGLSPYIPEADTSAKASLPDTFPAWASNGGPFVSLLNRSRLWIEADTYPKARALSPFPNRPIR